MEENIIVKEKKNFKIYGQHILFNKNIINKKDKNTKKKY